MFRRAGQCTRPYLRGLHQQTPQAAAPIPRSQGRTVAAVAFVSGVAVGSYLWYNNPRDILNKADLPATVEAATPFTPSPKPATLDAKAWSDPNALHSLVWGSNK